LYLCHSQVQDGMAFSDVFDIIAARFKEIVACLILKYSHLKELDIDSILENVKKEIANGASADFTASRGEYINGIILAKLLGYEFVDPAELIIFDESGVFDDEKTNSAIKNKLGSIERAVIPGFYGSMPDGTIKAFSRGGSDVTGAIIARGTQSNIYENWTDVSGFMMADPRIVPDAKPIDIITYRELRELSYMGASVLHEEAVFPVREAGIPINIKNTNKPEDKGTLIVDDKTNNTKSSTITGIAGKKNFTVIAIEKHLMNNELGFCRRILSIFEHNGINFECMPSGIDSVSLVVEDKCFGNKLDSVLEEIKKQCKPDSIVVHPNMALIATVGKGMSRTKGIASTIFSALAAEQVNIRMINQGSSEINIIVGVEVEDFDRSVSAIYNAFMKK